MSMLHVRFDHGLGDCTNFAHLMQIYRRRGYDFAISSNENKALIWRAAGTREPSDGAFLSHEWPHPPRFNRAESGDDILSNKVAWNVNRPPLPHIGDTNDLWRELCSVNLEGSVEPFISIQDSLDAHAFIKHMPRPLVLFHTVGATAGPRKNIPDVLASELYRELLSGPVGSLILLDWDNRGLRLSNERVRHIATDCGQITLGQLAALMNESDLLIGIDSGPHHFASLTHLPALGVFHQHYPACLGLPRAINVNMVSARQRHANIGSRARWNIVEYAFGMPSAGEIVAQVRRMLAGPRYGLPLGRDVMLQQWVWDWYEASRPRSAGIGRRYALDLLLRETTRRFVDPIIVETGCIRAEEDWSAGYSTYVFSAYVDGRGAGRLISLDSNVDACCFARERTNTWQARATIVCTDSISWLSSSNESIDVLYLDSTDTDDPAQAEVSLRETEAAESKLSEAAIVAYDDSPWDGGWVGRGARAIPYLLGRGWRVIGAGHQTLLSRVSPTSW